MSSMLTPPLLSCTPDKMTSKSQEARVAPALTGSFNIMTPRLHQTPFYFYSARPVFCWKWAAFTPDAWQEQDTGLRLQSALQVTTARASALC